MLWLKAFHIIFVVTWFAGLFYLPRLFVYHAVTTDRIGLDRFEVMERRLFTLMNVAALLALGFGIAVLAMVPAYLELPWMQLKLALVVLLIGYHLLLWRTDQAPAHRHEHPIATLVPVLQRITNAVSVRDCDPGRSAPHLKKSNPWKRQ